jgi:hypothetical protein
MCTKREFLPPATFSLWLLLTTVLISTRLALAADPPTIKQALGVQPHHSDVDFDNPDPKTYDQCKVAAHKEGKASGWLVTGPEGQPLRRFMDTNGDDVVDQFCFYKNGLEVYRDIDSNYNKKKDQFRWLNTGGMRWGIDTNEDGKIDVWKQISAEEVSRIAVRALVSQDASLVTPLLVTKEDLKSLGIKGTLESKLLASVADAPAKLKKAGSGSKIINPRTTWLRFDSAPPGSVPAESNKTATDLVVYENVMAIVDYGNPMAPGLIHVGELVRVGDVWKMTSIPTPMEGTSVEIQPGLVLNAPLANTGPGAPPGPVPSKDMTALLEKLKDLVQNPPPPNASKDVLEKYQKELEAVHVAIIKEVKTDEEKAQWTRQLLDTILAGVQSGADLSGIARLKKLEAQILKDSPKSPLAVMARYRVMLAEYVAAMQEADDKDREKIHEKWLADLAEFLDDNPHCDDAPEAEFQLAVYLEFGGKSDKARTWYDRIVKDFPDSDAGTRAQAARHRLDLTGKTLSLSGPSLTGGTIDVKQFRGKLLCVVFWDTNNKTCLDDLPLLKELYATNHAKGFEIIGVNLDSAKQPVTAYLAKHDFKWPQIFQPGVNAPPPLAQEFGIVMLPTMFLVDADGKVLNRSATLADLKTMLAEKSAKK